MEEEGDEQEVEEEEEEATERATEMPRRDNPTRSHSAFRVRNDLPGNSLRLLHFVGTKQFAFCGVFTYFFMTLSDFLKQLLH